MTPVEFIDSVGFDKRASVDIKKTLDKVGTDPKFIALIEAIRAKDDFGSIREQTAAYSVRVGIDNFALNLALFCAAAPIMKERFDKAGISGEVFLDTARDLTYKARECLAMENVWGVFTFEWYQRFFEAERFALGRLQYEETSFSADSYVCGESKLKRGDTVVNIHIPSGGKLTPEAVSDSFARAFDFFDGRGSKAIYGSGSDRKLIISCSSWLLYPPYKALYGECPNLAHFAGLFTALRVNNQNEFGDAWRVFNTRDVSDPNALPTDTALQRAFVKYIREGGRFGNAYCICAANREGKII